MKTLNFNGYHQGLPTYGDRPSLLSKLQRLGKSIAQTAVELIQDIQVVFNDVSYAFS